jgi:CYTH domain-containing protein
LASKGTVDVVTPKNKDVKMEFFQLEEVFLKNQDDTAENFIRKLGKNDSFIYSHEMRNYQKGERIEKKRQISAREYIEIFEQSRDTDKKVLKKVRQCFMHDNQYFIVETFLNVDDQPSFLRIETANDVTEIRIPEFLKLVRDISNDKAYTSLNMSRKDFKMIETDKKMIKEAIVAAKKSSPNSKAKHLPPAEKPTTTSPPSPVEITKKSSIESDKKSPV